MRSSQTFVQVNNGTLHSDAPSTSPKNDAAVIVTYHRFLKVIYNIFQFTFDDHMVAMDFSKPKPRIINDSRELVEVYAEEELKSKVNRVFN